MARIRLDTPYINKDGKPLKYLTPVGAKNILDVHPSMTARLQDATVPLIVTEGARKADALTTIGRCAISLAGVWNWVTKMSDGRRGVPLQDFESISLYDRRVILMFDSDARSNANVRLALGRLDDMLTSRGAKVEVVLPPAGPNGEKQGIDDYLAAGGDFEALWTLQETEPVAQEEPSRTFTKLQEQIAKYVVMGDAAQLVVALWVVHAHRVLHFEQTPYLTITSPQRQCGKSRLIELLEMLVPRPWVAITPSDAVVYREVHKRKPTLLLDEVDTIFAPKTADRYEGLRAIINAGHRRGATVPRCLNFGADAEHFSVYCAKVLAGIGVLPATITDRSIPIRLARKTRSEKVERFRLRTARAECEPIRTALASWAAQNGEALADARPDLPEELSDRMQEGCEPAVSYRGRPQLRKRGTQCTRGATHRGEA